ncbi:hypothetical protein [Brevundimonas sp.]|uniref:hypothetical protein n=1 Tax=Brevundimonas sp. TaxID=1871086 RepID=UPI0035682DF1
MLKIRMKRLGLLLGFTSAILAAPAVAQEHQQQVGDETTTTEWCYYNHHPDTGKIAKYCEVTISSSAGSLTYGYWKTDGTGPVYA